MKKQTAYPRSVVQRLASFVFGLWFLSTLILSPLALANPSSSPIATGVETGWLTSDFHPHVETRVVLTGQVDEQTQTVEGFLEVRLSGDWKTYWRSPGEGGIAPSLDWQQSSNIKAIKWEWPYPHRFELLGLETLGYKHDVVFPLHIEVNDIHEPVNLSATATISSCTTVCVLTDFPIDMTFVPSELSLSETAMYQYAQAMSLVPKASPFIDGVQAIWDASRQELQVTVLNARGWVKPDLLIDSQDDVVEDYSFLSPKINIDGDKVVATFKVTSWLGDPDLDSRSILVTMIDENLLAEQAITVNSGVITGNDIASALSSASMLSMLGFALLGGLILNIMPCVFPVLGMKLSHVISAATAEKTQIRAQFVASSMGIITSFLLLALFITVLKWSGSSIGWGIQFQSGGFIAVMVLITGLFGANMLGLFELRLPSSMNTWMATKGDNSYVGHFVQGMFATLLATPCSAPFLGTAVAFALATSTSATFAIFTALGLGMALPWVLIALFPSLVSWLPKPGAWMNRVKILFGSMMLLTSTWLLSLLSHHLPPFWIGVLALAALVWLFLRVKSCYGDKPALLLGGVSIIALAGGLMIGSMTADRWATPLPPEPDWAALSTTRIANEVAAGHTVFVDVTADWCITCKANKIGVILQPPVYDTLQQSDVIAMKGDWTTPSDDVTAFLRFYGRYGVPFNIVFGPNAPDGIPLPVILTNDAVLNAISSARGEQ
ncbi:thioredoxin family protein [Vibrio sp. ZSDZ65]|uniref:Thioredoxin family protein n=1 Tax=Vibrio qingdaonensis TaxID=2829491 RepID=A0A9X3CK78_9VIBR|nr:protein-disulfide reductase DsbD domain-containing protein [Vibrio qingdaonensis]MCW8344821.1 thioredoxin family protein [Vibrio qingdaonensis]